MSSWDEMVAFARNNDKEALAANADVDLVSLLHSYLLICPRNMFEPVYYPLLNDIDRLQARFPHVKLALFAFGWLARRGFFDAAKAVLYCNWRYHVDVTSVCQFWEDMVRETSAETLQPIQHWLTSIDILASAHGRFLHASAAIC
jgi:hypothetical protein